MATPSAAAVADHAVLRASAAMRELASELKTSFAAEAARLEAAHDRFRQAPADPAAVAELRTRAHDLKGLGATCGQPLAGRIAASLERILKSASAPHRCSALVDAHVATFRAVLRHDALGRPDPQEAAVIAALEAATAAVLDAP